MALILWLTSAAGCSRRTPADKAALEAPQRNVAVVAHDPTLIHVEQPERFTTAVAALVSVVGRLDVTGSVQPDVSREIPVLSLANGRVVALHVGLGDFVHKGQLVMEVQSADVATAFGSYLKAVSDEHLAQVTLTRDTLLYDKGAIARSQLEVAQNGEDDAKAGLAAAVQQLRILGVDKDRPGDTVKVYAPASGIVIAQNATAAGAAGVGYAGPAGSLTIADLSHVWVVCDVYENDLATVRLGEHADIRIDAFPGQVFSGTISDIGAALDASLRTAKVRIQVANPAGQLRLGMFATASLTGSHGTPTMSVPQGAVLHLHDRSYVFTPVGGHGDFRRIEVQTGPALGGNNVSIRAGLSGGQTVVTNALDLENTADQE